MNADFLSRKTEWPSKYRTGIFFFIIKSDDNKIDALLRERVRRLAHTRMLPQMIWAVIIKLISLVRFKILIFQYCNNHANNPLADLKGVWTPSFPGNIQSRFLELTSILPNIDPSHPSSTPERSCYCQNI